MSEGDTEEDNIPDRETCEGLTQQFAEVTGTDVALAQYYLQDRNWDLQVCSPSVLLSLGIMNRLKYIYSFSLQ